LQKAITGMSINNTINRNKILFRGTKIFKLLKSKFDSLETSISGFKLIAHPLDWSFWLSTHQGAWEAETLKIYRDHLQHGTRYCDIGGWVGPTALLAAKLGADVTCFEPDPKAYERLLHNVRVNSCHNIQLFQIALSSSDGIKRIAPITDKLGQSSSSIHIGSSGKESAAVLALSWDSACALLKLPVFDFIKIDIEGGEFELIPSMMEYLTAHKPKVFLSTHLPFIDTDRKDAYIKVIQDLSALYSEGDKPDLNAMAEGFPSYLFK
jgi:FkbM family methyltransferase